MPEAGGRRKGAAKAAHTRAQVVAAAAELFSRKTYLDTTMDEIADAAGVSKGGMYYHYRKKSEVLFDITKQAMDDLWSGLDEDLGACPTAREKLRRLIERQLLYYAGHLPQVRVLLNERHGLDPDQAAIVVELESRYFDVARALVAEAIGSDDPARVNPIAFGLFGMCNWIPGWYRATGPASIEVVATTMARLFLEGLDGFATDGKER